MNHRTATARISAPAIVPTVGLWIALLFALAACQAQVTPSSASAAAPGTAAPAVTAAPTAEPPDPHVVGQWDIRNPSFLAFGFGSVWVTDHYGNDITRIDPVSNEVVAVIKGTGDNPEEALEVGGLLWVTGQHDDTVLIDPTTNAITRTLEGSHLFMDAAFGSVWITTRDNKLDRFDPSTAALTASITVADGSSDCMNDVVASAAAVWVISCDLGELIRIDPTTESVVSRTPFASLISEAKAQTHVPGGKGTNSLWLTLLGDEGAAPIPSGLLRVDPTSGVGLAFLPLSSAHAGDGFNAVTDDAVWLAGSEEINRVDVASNRIVATYPTAPGRLKIGVAFGSVWLRNFERNRIQRLDYQL